ncbi:DUF3553 domain-containing protein [Roseospira visakhapatnamensis]|uniref:DUF3553 domain-containing protein n=1 Tax=Roseospira visakhapatnamensis TaxID=390880 RepID=A0A7W6RFD5_9PROT|nr:DUF3553 domain-containing protein [Roseospira visakhapatnamensis]MBB4267521.1 hypothetical protein [Roseospira visakhapatnamensis]
MPEATILPFTPGAWVRLPTQPDWGLGQVQTVVGPQVTVNFENQGKQVVNIAAVDLDLVEEARPPRG